MLLTGKNYGKTVEGNGNVGILFGRLYLKLWQMKWFMQQAVGCWQNQDDCYGLISSVASCLPTQQPPVQEGNLICQGIPCKH